MKKKMQEYDELKAEINHEDITELNKQPTKKIDSYFIIMSKSGHNNPPIPLDPKETIKKNINRRKLIVDDGISLFKGPFTNMDRIEFN